VNILISRSPVIEEYLVYKGIKIDQVHPFLTRKMFTNFDQIDNTIFGMLSAPATARLLRARVVYIEISSPKKARNGSLTLETLKAFSPALLEMRAQIVRKH